MGGGGLGSLSGCSGEQSRNTKNRFIIIITHQYNSYHHREYYIDSVSIKTFKSSKRHARRFPTCQTTRTHAHARAHGGRDKDLAHKHAA